MTTEKTTETTDTTPPSEPPAPRELRFDDGLVWDQPGVVWGGATEGEATAPTTDSDKEST